MGQTLRIFALHLPRFRSMFGSGEEAFCAKVLRRIPEAAQRLGLRQEWTRGVTGLVLGEPGAALSERLPFETSDLTKATPGFSLAFASVVMGFATEGLGGSLPMSGTLREELLHRPLFGLEPDGDVVRWGGLSKHQLKSLAGHPLIAPIWANGLDVISLSGSFGTDPETGGAAVREGD
ncbi:MAG TPA: hypothetical protein VKW04_14195 [Planctomycetota bacterium]|nr:hypothetical protein [Planctomycetota bacterium]